VLNWGEFASSSVVETRYAPWLAKEAAVFSHPRARSISFRVRRLAIAGMSRGPTIDGRPP
jgi:hypothetical protein